MLLASIIVSIVCTLAMIFVLRHPPKPNDKGEAVAAAAYKRHIHRPHLPHIRRPRHDN